MSDEPDRDLQDWFKRSAEALPEQPFALTVLEQVWRRELRLRVQRYAAFLVAAFSFYLLLPELMAYVGTLALRLAVADTGGARSVVLGVTAAGLAYMLALRGVRR